MSEYIFVDMLIEIDIDRQNFDEIEEIVDKIKNEFKLLGNHEIEQKPIHHDDKTYISFFGRLEKESALFLKLKYPNLDIRTSYISDQLKDKYRKRQ